jgi:hypothetical protein
MQHYSPLLSSSTMGELMPTTNQNAHDEDAGKGAVEQDRPNQKTNVSTTGQNGHRNQDARLETSDTDFPEPGENEEHTGEPNARDTGVNPEGVDQDQDPGFRQKENQNKSKDDPLAA